MHHSLCLAESCEEESEDEDNEDGSQESESKDFVSDRGGDLLSCVYVAFLCDNTFNLPNGQSALLWTESE